MARKFVCDNRSHVCVMANGMSCVCVMTDLAAMWWWPSDWLLVIVPGRWWWVEGSWTPPPQRLPAAATCHAQPDLLLSDPTITFSKPGLPLPLYLPQHTSNISSSFSSGGGWGGVADSGVSWKLCRQKRTACSSMSFQPLCCTRTKGALSQMNKCV